MRCGSMSPVTIFRSALMKPRSSQISVPRAGAPEMHVLAQGCARRGCGNGSARRSRRWSSRSARRGCLPDASPVATRISMRSRAMPAASRVRRIGGRTMPLGTGRVLSEITTTASRRPAPAPASGASRPARQHLVDRRGGIGKRCALRRLDDRHVDVVGQAYIQPRAPIVETNIHDRLVPNGSAQE